LTNKIQRQALKLYLFVYNRINISIGKALLYTWYILGISLV